MRVQLVLKDFTVNSKAVVKRNMQLIFGEVMRQAVERFYITLRSRIPVWSGQAQASTLVVAKQLKRLGSEGKEFSADKIRAEIKKRAIARLGSPAFFFHRDGSRTLKSTFINRRMAEGEKAGTITYEARAGVWDFDYTSDLVQMEVHGENTWKAFSSAHTAAAYVLRNFIANITQAQLQEILTGRIKDVKRFVAPIVSPAIIEQTRG